MIIDSNKRVITIQLRRLLTLLGVIAIAIGIILLGKLPNTFLGLNKYHWALAVGILYVFSIAIDMMFEFTYVYYNDETDKIVFRFFSLNYFNKKKQSIEIPKAEFTSFILKETRFGYNKKIILRRFFKNLEAKYPAISLSILSKEQFAQLLISLDYHSKHSEKA